MPKVLEIRCVTGFEAQAERLAAKEREVGHTVATKTADSCNAIGGFGMSIQTAQHWQQYDAACAWVAENLVPLS